MVDNKKPAKPAFTSPTGNFFVVRADQTPDDNFRDIDTVSGIAAEWLKKNPKQDEFKGKNFKEKQDAVIKWIEKENHLKNGKGVECDGKEKTGGIIHVGQPLILPAGEKIVNPPQHRIPCPIHILVLPPEAPVASAPAPAPVAAPAPVIAPVPEITTRVLGQVAPDVRRTQDERKGSDAVDFFVGRPPQRAAVDYRTMPDALRNKGKNTNYEGAYASTAAKPGALETFGHVPEENRLALGRANVGRAWYDILGLKPGGELEHAPGQHDIIDDRGNAVKPNAEWNQKIEVEQRLQYNANGELVSTRDSGALISKRARENPDSQWRLREGFTAELPRSPLSNTAEGKGLVVTYMGYDNLYNKIVATHADKPLPAADAEKLLQLNIQAANHLLVRSVHSFDIDVKTTDQLRTEMLAAVGRVADQAEKNRLTDAYLTPFANSLDDPKLGERIKDMTTPKDASGAFSLRGQTAWVNPMMEWAKERKELDFIKEGYGTREITEAQKKEKLGAMYGDRDARLGRKEVRELQAEETDRVAVIYANMLQQQATRAFTPTEVKLATGLLHNPNMQSELNLSRQRNNLLQKVVEDDKALEAVVNHWANSPEGFQHVRDLLHSTSYVESGNFQLLDYKNPEEARVGAQKLASGLAGKKQGAELMRNEGTFIENFGAAAVHLVTVGIITPGKNRNQNNGVYGFDEEVKKRLDDPKTRPEVLLAMKEVFQRALDAQQSGNEAGIVASTQLVLGLNPSLAEKHGPAIVASRDAAFKAIGKEGEAAVYNQWVANQNTAGNAELTAAVAEKTAELAKQGKVTTVSPEAAAAAIAATAAGTKLVLTGGDRPAVDAAKAFGVTILPTDLKARMAAAQRLTPNEALVSPEQINARYVTQQADKNPASFATLLVAAIVEAERSGDKTVAASLKGQVGAMAAAGGAKAALADLINANVAAANAGTPPTDGIIAIENAQKSFGGFFASKGDAKVNAIAVKAFAGALASDPVSTAALTKPVQDAANGLLRALPAAQINELTAIDALPAGKAKDAAFAKAIGSFVDGNNQAFAGWGVSAVEAVKMAFMLYRSGKPGEPDKPLNPGDVPQCGTTANPIACPITPGAPVLPPPATPPVPPAPTAPLPPPR